MSLRTYRSSSLPRIIECAQSGRDSDVAIDTGGAMANMGSAVHDILGRIVEQGLDAVPALDDAAARWGIDDVDELLRLSRIGLNAWRILREDLRVLGVEMALKITIKGCAVITGHVDVLAENSAGDLVVIDWKSGHLQHDYREQLMAYLFMAFRHKPGYKTGKTVLVWLRMLEWQVDEFPASAIDAWETRLKESIGRDTYSPGAACMYCPRVSDCEPRSALMRSTGTDILAAGDEYEITPETLVALYPRSRMLKAAIDRYEKMLKAQLAASGEIPTGDGRMMRLDDVATDRIDFTKAYPAIAEYFGESPDAPTLIPLIGDALSVRKGALLDRVAMLAPRGEKAHTKIEFMDTLRARGAVTTTTAKKIVTVKEENQDESKKLTD